MSDSPIPPRPPTPQVLLHRLPDKPSDVDSTRKPSKYIILIMASHEVAGKVQIAQSVATALSCPLYQGDSLHESSAKAANVGASRSAPTAAAAGASSAQAAEATSGPNKTRYQRMWLSKLTRTGLLFPEESRPATEGFSGFGGTSSTSTSRRGSVSSIASISSNAGPSSSVVSSRRESMDAPHHGLPTTSTYILDPPASSINPAFTMSGQERLRRANPALMVLTHPDLESWHKAVIRSAVGDYGIGVIFVPLSTEEGEDEDDLPILRPLDPTTMTSFPTSFGSFKAKARGWGNLDEEMKLRIDVDADVEGKTAEIIEGVRDVMGVDE